MESKKVKTTKNINSRKAVKKTVKNKNTNINVKAK